MARQIAAQRFRALLVAAVLVATTASSSPASTPVQFQPYKAYSNNRRYRLVMRPVEPIESCNVGVQERRAVWGYRTLWSGALGYAHCYECNAISDSGQHFVIGLPHGIEVRRRDGVLLATVAQDLTTNGRFLVCGRRASLGPRFVGESHLLVTYVDRRDGRTFNATVTVPIVTP